MAKAKKLKSGSWRVQVFSHYDVIDGKKKARYISYTAPSRAEAELWAAQFRGDKDRYRLGKITVGEAVEKYIESRVNVLSPSTIRTYRMEQRKHIDLIKDILVSSISTEDLQRYVDSLAVYLSPKSVKNAYNLVLASIRVYSDRMYRVTLPSLIPPTFHIPTDEDVALLMREASDNLRLAIALSAIGTLRRGEICGLKYKDVLYDFVAVYVHSDVVLDENGKWIHKSMPKNSSSIRRVPLPESVMELIGTGDADEYVYKGTPGTLTDQFYDLRDRLGLRCRFHDLRHYAASVMHAIGIPDQYIMERGGWSTDATLKSVYRNTLSDKSKRFTDKTNQYFDDALFRKSAK